MEKTWAVLLLMQKWVWIGLVWFFKVWLILLVLAIFVGIGVSKYFKWKETRESKDRR